MIRTIQTFTNPIERIYRSLNKYPNLKIDFFAIADEDGYELRLGWIQGNNIWVIRQKIYREELLLKSIDWWYDEISNLVNIRDTKIKSIEFWTNCKI